MTKKLKQMAACLLLSAVFLMSESSQLAVVMAAEKEGAQTEALPAEASDAGQTRVRRLIELLEQDEAAKSSEQIIFTAVLTDQTDSDAAVTDFLERLGAQGGRATELARYSEICCGVTFSAPIETAVLAAEMTGVEAVYPDRSYAPRPAERVRRRRDASSLDLIRLKRESGEWDGRGTLIAVIDSGGEAVHEHFRLDDGIVPKYTESEAREQIRTKKLRGTYFNQKVPYGYNYADRNHNLSNGASDHGMHVAGIVAGNPPAGETRLAEGVAPNAQLAIMRVFGSGSKARAQSHTYALALEDCIKLGVSSANMSLGLGAGTAGMEDPLFLKALQAARKAGIQVVIAGGNDGRFGYGSSRPSVEFPDYGLISTPGVLPDGLTVASLENTYTVMGAISVEDGSDDMLHGELYKNNLITDEAAFYDTWRQTVDCGYGTVDDFKETQLAGKAALVRRGKVYFKDIMEHAAARGADFVVVINSEAEGNELPSMSVGDAKLVSTVIS